MSGRKNKQKIIEQGVEIITILTGAETAGRTPTCDACESSSDNVTTFGEKEGTPETIFSRAAVNPVKIFYAGYMSSPFAVQDKELLEQNAYAVSIFNLTEAASTFSQVPGYLVKVFTRILPGVLKNDVVWIWGADYPALPFLLFCTLFRKKLVIALFGVETYPPNEIGYGFRMQKFRGAVSKFIMQHADMNIPMSDAYWDLLTDYIPDAHAWTVYGAVDINQFKPDFAAKEKVAVTAYCDYKLSPVIKGIPVFEEATRYAEHLNCPFKLNIIHNRSYKTQIAAFLQAKVYCQLSFTEQFGMSLLEAMACGCVPVVSDRDGLPELIGKTGVVVPYGDVPATLKGIEKAMAMDGQQARERAERYYSKDLKKMHMRNIITIVMNRNKSYRELLELME